MLPRAPDDRGPGNGVRAAHAAGMRVVAIPNRQYLPPEEALAYADVVLISIADLDASTLNGEGAR